MLIKVTSSAFRVTLDYNEHSITILEPLGSVKKIVILQPRIGSAIAVAGN